jgi:hypothetical protein
MNPIEIIPLTGLPLIQPGDPLAQLLGDAIARSGGLRDRDVLVIAQKIVSKAEGRYVDLDQVSPSPRAIEVARQCAKDPRLIEVILSESSEVVRLRRDLIITRHRLGFVSANAGVDRSNVAPEGIDRVLLLPIDLLPKSDRLSAIVSGPILLSSSPTATAARIAWEPWGWRSVYRVWRGSKTGADARICSATRCSTPKSALPIKSRRRARCSWVRPPKRRRLSSCAARPSRRVMALRKRLTARATWIYSRNPRICEDLRIFPHFHRQLLPIANEAVIEL